ncbi:MAG: pyridoxamine 5'-phosphate oxidase family protein [Chloroflexota bacterium]|nr:pyridoxamine 5'-phosphate oxidase family protein [Chloroflexota bacterium]
MGKIYVLPDHEIERLLSTALVGRIACCATEFDGEARPYVVPLAYGYDGESVYAFSSLGRKIHIMRAQPLVSFEVDEAIAEDRWSSVIADGGYEELVSSEDRRLAHRIIFGPESSFPDFSPDQIVYRLRLSQKSGRFEIPDGEEPFPNVLPRA